MNLPLHFNLGLIGKDGRTDAISEKCAESDYAPRLSAMSELLIPGLVQRCEGRVTVDDLTDPEAIARWADQVNPRLVVVGPEDPLAAGAVDVLEARRIACFGPLKDLALIESSKAWARQLLDEFAIPGNPEYRLFETAEGIESHLKSMDEFVVKPDGLTGGKGVRVYPEHFSSLAEAIDYAADAATGDGRVLIEERLVGEEFSLQTITDAVSVVHCPVVQDHKRAYEGDTGPNTGGMGSYSCEDHLLPFLLPSDLDAAQRINEQVIEAMFRKTGLRYRGVLYGGFIATKDGVRLIEYNCRFGDPEALNVLPLMTTDFVEMAFAVAEGRLGEVLVEFAPKATVCKYIVPDGYPGGALGDSDLVHVPDDVLNDPAVRVYWAACRQEADGVHLTGSRALGVVGIGDSLHEAEQAAQHAAKRVGGLVRFRTDIGTEALVNQRVRHMASLRGGPGQP